MAVRLRAGTLIITVSGGDLTLHADLDSIIRRIAERAAMNPD